MSEILKQSMSSIWASAGDIVMPDVSKIADGWAVEVVPRQYWNWMQNRTDVNLAYLFQHGIPEWDATVEYVANKSYVTYADVVYKAILTGTNKIPSSQPTYWKVAFATSTAALEALKATTPAADKLPYFSGTTTATTTTLTPLARSLLDDTTQAAMLTTIGAQPVDATLTALAGQTTAANKLSYFTGVDAVSTTDFTAFARTILDDADAVTVRATLGLGSAALEALKATTPAADKLPYFNGATTAATTTITPLARTLLDDTTQGGMLTTIGAQPVDATLTALAGQTTAANKLSYFTGVDAVSTTDFTAFARTILDDADAVTVRATLGLGSAALNNTGDFQPIDSDLTAIAALATTGLIERTGTGTAGIVTITAAGKALLDDADAAAQRTTLSLNNVNNTSDANKPVSTATQTALNLKAPLASPAFTGSVSIPTIELGSQVGASNAFIDFHSGAVVTNYDSRILATTGTGNGTAGNGTLHIVAGVVDMTNGAAGAQTVIVNTAPADTNSPVAASTAFVVGQASSTAPVMSGTAAVGTSLKYARADHVHPRDTTKAPLASPALTGTPTVPTAAVGTNTTQAASTAYVRANAVVKDSDVGSAAIPSGTTAQRTATPVYGSLRANTTLMLMEWWNGTAWLPVGSGKDLVTVGQLGLSKYYESPEQVITSGGLLTLPHGLGVTPKLVTGELVCKTAEQGYSIGQIIGAQIWFYSDSTVDNKGVTFVRDASNLTGRCGSNAAVFSANHFTTGTGIPLTNTSWRLIVRAWA